MSSSGEMDSRERGRGREREGLVVHGHTCGSSCIQGHLATRGCCRRGTGWISTFPPAGQDHQELHHSWYSIERSHSSKPLPSRVCDLAITSFLAVFAMWYTSKLCSTPSANIFSSGYAPSQATLVTATSESSRDLRLLRTNTFHSDRTAWFSHLDQFKPSCQFSLGMH